MAATITLRPARKDDAVALARLIAVAGEGLGAHLWAAAAGPNETPLDVGIKRAQREEGGFSYRNATVAEVEGAVAGLLLGYRLPDPYDAGDVSALPALIRPLIELESCVPGSWYVNALSTFEERRGIGVGSALMREAARLAADTGARTVSLVTAEQNARARRLYERCGYRIMDRRPLVAFPGFPHTGDWVLMTKNVV